MNKTAWLIILTLVPLQSYSKGLKSALKEHQSQLAPKAVKESGGSPAPEVTSAVAVIPSSNKMECIQNDQNSMPLSYLTPLLLEQDGKLNVNYDPRTRTLKVDAPKMISNCSTMLDWGVKEQNVGGKHSYVVEVAFKKKGVECTTATETAPSVCTYQVAKVKDGIFEKFEPKSFPPTLVGFEQCLEYAGVLKDDKIVADKVHQTPLLQKFPGVKESGEVLFVSNGPRSKEGAQFGDFVSINSCDHYENITTTPMHITSLEEEMEAEKQKLKKEVEECGDYKRQFTFLADHPEFGDLLKVSMDNLLERAKVAAAKINDGKYDADDLAVMADFSKYIVDEKVANVINLYERAQTAKSPQKEELVAQLVAAKKELNDLNSRPFFVDATNQRLIADGKFDDSKKLHALKVTLDTYSKLGNPINNNVKLTPEIADKTLIALRGNYANEIAAENERYEIKQGRVTGTADAIKQRMNNLRQGMIYNNGRYQQELASEQARVTAPQGACYQNSYTTQRCLQDSMLRIQQIQQEQVAENKKAQEEMTRLEAQHKVFADLELQGKRAIASREGTPMPEAPKDQAQQGAQVIKDGQNPDGSYNFNFNNGQAQNPNQQALLQQQAALNAQMQMMQQQMIARSQSQFQYSQQSNMFAQPMMYPQPQQQGGGGIGSLLSGLFGGGGNSGINAGFQAQAGYGYGYSPYGGYQPQQAFPGYMPQMNAGLQPGYSFNYPGNPMMQPQMSAMPFYGANNFNLYAR